MVARKYNN